MIKEKRNKIKERWSKQANVKSKGGKSYTIKGKTTFI